MSPSSFSAPGNGNHTWTQALSSTPKYCSEMFSGFSQKEVSKNPQFYSSLGKQTTAYFLLFQDTLLP